MQVITVRAFLSQLFNFSRAQLPKGHAKKYPKMHHFGIPMTAHHTIIKGMIFSEFFSIDCIEGMLSTCPIENQDINNTHISRTNLSCMSLFFFSSSSGGGELESTSSNKCLAMSNTSCNCVTKLLFT